MLTSLFRCEQTRSSFLLSGSAAGRRAPNLAWKLCLYYELLSCPGHSGRYVIENKIRNRPVTMGLLTQEILEPREADRPTALENGFPCYRLHRSDVGSSMAGWLRPRVSTNKLQCCMMGKELSPPLPGSAWPVQAFSQVKLEHPPIRKHKYFQEGLCWGASEGGPLSKREKHLAGPLRQYVSKPNFEHEHDHTSSHLP